MKPRPSLGLPFGESAAVFRAALRRGLVMDGIKPMVLPLRSKIYRGRRYLRRFVSSEPPAPPDAPQPWRSPVPYTAMGTRATERLRVEPPEGPPSPATFRAGGAARLPFPLRGAVFTDAEDEHAWNRLYWALESTDPKTLSALEEWLDGPLSDAARRPYTTSERICTLAQILGTRGKALPAELGRRISDRILSDASWLFVHVETRLGAHNHILNNARALHVAARLLDDGHSAAAWLGRAREIWDEFWPKLILDDGVFGEQSSHYHVMLTRTLLAYVEDALTSGRSLPAGMPERARAMCRVTNALIRADGSLPLFGDISPDLPVSWLRGLPRVCSRGGLLAEPPRDSANGYAAGASASFGGPRLDSVPAGPERPAEGWKSTLFPTGGFLFAVNPSMSLELAVHGDPRPRSSCHGDSGRGSFEIWRGGRRIIVDGGVPTYEPGRLRDHFRGSDGQNVVSIDDLAPVLLMDQARELPGWYVDSLEGGSWEVDATGATFTWRGFRRCRPGLDWIRSFRWSGVRVDISDRLEGWTGEVDVEARVHFGERGWVRRSSARFGTDGCEVQVTHSSGLTASLVEMPHATDYGVLINGLGIRMRGRVRIPTAWAWSFEFDPEETT